MNGKVSIAQTFYNRGEYRAAAENGMSYIVIPEGVEAIEDNAFELPELKGDNSAQKP